MGLASVSKESITNILTRGGADGRGMGRAVTIVVGGARESLETHPGRIRLVLKCRRGFIKLAITTGSDLVPVLCFGENDIYDTVDSSQRPWLHRTQMFMKKAFGFTAPIFHARGVFNYDVGIMPYRRPLNIVVGKPIKVEKRAVADEKYVLELQEKYIQELEKMFDDWKEEFAPDRIEDLNIVE
jgi:1-acyl-sn-glycerol-3-phosphate acyltransferase